MEKYVTQANVGNAKICSVLFSDKLSSFATTKYVLEDCDDNRRYSHTPRLKEFGDFAEYSLIVLTVLLP